MPYGIPTFFQGAYMIKKVKSMIAFLIIAGGIVMICYPSFAGFVNQTFANREITDYDEKIKDSSEDELNEAMRTAYRYNATLPGGYPADPFTGKNIAALEGTGFEDFWMVQTGAMIGYVEVPSIDVYLPIYYGTTREVLKEGAGLLENSSLPVGGASTHAVLSAHTGMASKRLFTDLDHAQKGDIFFIHILGQDLAYKVDQIKVVLPSESEELYIEEGKDRVTLLTCTPFGINDHRLLVRGDRLDYDPGANGDKQHAAPEVMVRKYLWMYVIAALAVFALCCGIVHLMKKKRKKN